MEAADHGLSNKLLKHIQEPQMALLRQTQKKWFKLGPTNTVGILDVIIRSGWWLTYPSEKWWTSSVGMMTFPTERKFIKAMFQTTNQIFH